MAKFINEQDIENLNAQIEGLKTAISEVKDAGMMNKAARAEDALDKVYSVIAGIAENQHKAYAELEDLRANGLQNP